MAFIPQPGMTLRLIGGTKQRGRDTAGEPIDVNAPYKLMYAWKDGINVNIQRVDGAFYPDDPDKGSNFWIVPLGDLAEWEGDKIDALAAHVDKP